jgi:ketosteroid isomerase-like protein
MADNVATVRAVYEAFALGDITKLLAALDDRVEWYEAEHITYWPGGPFIGPQSVIEGVIARTPQDFDGLTIDVRRIVGCGETVVAEGRYRGTVKATGKALDAQLAHVWDFRDGKVVRFQQYSDTWQFAEVTGVSPANASAITERRARRMARNPRRSSTVH